MVGGNSQNGRRKGILIDRNKRVETDTVGSLIEELSSSHTSGGFEGDPRTWGLPREGKVGVRLP